MRKSLFTLFVVIFSLCITIPAQTSLASEGLIQNEAEAERLRQTWDLAPTERSVKLLEETAIEWTRLSKPNRATDCLNRAAEYALDISDLETAIRVLRRAIELENINRLTDEKIISLSLFALVSRTKGDRKNSEFYSNKAIELSQGTNSATSLAYAHFSSGMHAYYYGKLENSTKSFEQAESYAMRTGNPFIRVQTLIYTGFAYIREGNAIRSADKMNSALREAENAGYRRGKAFSILAIGCRYYSLNEKQKALNSFKDAFSLYPDNFEWLDRGNILNMMGEAYVDLGEWNLAKTNFEQADYLFEKGRYPFGKVTALTNLAKAYTVSSDLNKALETYNSALLGARSIHDDFRIAVITEGIGSLLYEEHRFDQAANNYRNALAIYDKIGLKSPSTENLLGSALEASGDLVGATTYYIEALDLSRQIRNSATETDALFNLARLDSARGDVDAALIKIGESFRLTESLYSQLLNANLKRSYLSNIYDRYNFYVGLLMQNVSRSANKELALRTLENSHARTMLGELTLSEADFTKDADPELLHKEREIRVLINAKSDKLTDLLSHDADKVESEKVSSDINSLENQLEEIKAELKEKSPVYSAIKDPPAFDLGDFQANVLKDDEVLLEYFLGTEESYLWLVGKNEFEAYVLPGKDQIEGKVDALRELLDARKPREGETFQEQQNRIAEADAKFSPLAHELSDTVLGQVADKLAGKRLIVVPDGKLHYFPISALPLPNTTSDEPILLSNEVIYQPSAQTYSLLKTLRQNNRPANTKDLLVFSDPVFNKEDPRLSGINVAAGSNENKDISLRFVESLSSLKRLPASGTEAKSIEEVIGGSSIDSLSGFSATRERLLNSPLSDYRVLHFATHGLVNIDRPELSSIILSRYNESGQQIDESVRMQDIYAMKLNADLVVLSACETGTGKEVKGEGIMGLNTAFLQAGARSVVASLWPVEDNATNLMMREFYDGIGNRGLTSAASLRKAQLKLYNDPQFRSPFFWASFTLQGDGNVHPEFSNHGFKWLYASLAAIPLLILAFYLYRRQRRYSASKL